VKGQSGSDAPTETRADIHRSGDDVRAGTPPSRVERPTSAAAALCCVEPADSVDSRDEPAANASAIDDGNSD
jgi:hypothetical protein